MGTHWSTIGTPNQANQYPSDGVALRRDGRSVLLNKQSDRLWSVMSRNRDREQRLKARRQPRRTEIQPINRHGNEEPATFASATTIT
jgi:hypothetical protein